MPDLNVARAYHSSVCIEDTVYVACGEVANDEYTNSIEMLTIPASVKASHLAWKLIKMPGLTPRSLPVFS